MSRVVIILVVFLFVLNVHAGNPDEKMPLLIEAIVKNNDSAAEMILRSEKQANIEYGGSSALMFAVTPHCKLSFVEALLQQGADPNYRQMDTKTTPLLESLVEGSWECVEAMLAYGGDITLIDANGTGAAYRAVESGNIELVKKIASMGVDVDLPRKDGVTPIMYAARAGKKGIVSFLLSKGSLECRRNSRGLTPGNLAELSRDNGTIKLFTTSCDGK